MSEAAQKVDRGGEREQLGLRALLEIVHVAVAVDVHVHVRPRQRQRLATLSSWKYSRSISRATTFAFTCHFGWFTTSTAIATRFSPGLAWDGAKPVNHV